MNTAQSTDVHGCPICGQKLLGFGNPCTCSTLCNAFIGTGSPADEAHARCVHGFIREALLGNSLIDPGTRLRQLPSIPVSPEFEAAIRPIVERDFDELISFVNGVLDRPDILEPLGRISINPFIIDQSFPAIPNEVAEAIQANALAQIASIDAQITAFIQDHPKQQDERQKQIERLRREIAEAETNVILDVVFAAVQFLLTAALAAPSARKLKDTLVKAFKSEEGKKLMQAVAAAATTAAKDPAGFIKAVWQLLQFLVTFSGGIWGFIKNLFDFSTWTLLTLAANLVSWLGGPTKPLALVGSVAAFVWRIKRLIDAFRDLEEKKKRLQELEGGRPEPRR